MAVFKKADVDGVGYLNVHDIVTLIDPKVVAHLGVDGVKAMVVKYDTDASGTIEIDELGL